MYTHSLLLVNVQWIPPAVFCEFYVKIAVVPLNVMSCDLCTSCHSLLCCAVFQVLLWYTGLWQIISRVAVWLRRWKDTINLDLGKWVVRLKCKPAAANRPARRHSCCEIDNFSNTWLTHPLWVLWVNQPRDPFNSLADLTFKVTRQQITVHMTLYSMLYAWILARYIFAHSYVLGPTALRSVHRRCVELSCLATLHPVLFSYCGGLWSPFVSAELQQSEQ
jgi:hypothetical protein